LCTAVNFLGKGLIETAEQFLPLSFMID